MKLKNRRPQFNPADVVYRKTLVLFVIVSGITDRIFEIQNK